MTVEGRRIVVTGIGAVTPSGIGRHEFWDGLVSGRSVVRPITLFDASPYRSRIAAECDFEPLEHGLTLRDARRSDRYVQFALVSTDEAVTDAGLDMDSERLLERTAVVMGSAVGGTTALEHEYIVVSDGGEHWLVDYDYSSPTLYQALVPSSLANDISARFGAHGPAQVVSTGCTSGIDAIGYAHQLLQDGEADVAICGAADSPISPVTLASFDAIRATTPDNHIPDRASRPFDRDRHGFVLGEGGAVLVLEDLEHAMARGARIYCEILGFSARGNAFHMTGLRPDGMEMAAAITDAMDQGRVDPGEIDYINAHGSGTMQNDRHETAAYKRVCGDLAYDIPISSIKSMLGHSLGAIGSIEVAACCLAIDSGVVPPTSNWENRDPECDLDYVPNEARKVDPHVVLSVGSGFGGFQSAMVLGRFRGGRP